MGRVCQTPRVDSGVIMRVIWLFVLFLSFAGCSDDTAGTTNQCAAGETFNPISKACVPGGILSPDIGVPDSSTSDSSTPDADAPCMDCGPFYFEPQSLAFSFTPAREPTLLEATLIFQADQESPVESLEWEGSSEFQVVNLAVGDLVRQGQRTVSIQYSPTDNTPDTAVLRVHLANSSVGFAELKLSSTISGTEICSENCPRIQVEPRAITISYQPGDTAMNRPLTVGNVGQAPLEVREILVLQQGRAYSVAHDALPLLLEPNSNTVLDVGFNPAEIGTAGATIKIRSSDPFEPEVNVPVTATAKDSQNDPCIQVNPTSLNFGSVVRGSPVAKTFTLTNCGSRSLTVSAIERGRFFGIPTSAAFQITSPWTAGVIPAGGSEIIEMTFSPRRAGVESGFFLVRNDDPSNSAARVSVSGTSQAPPIADQDIHIVVDWDSNDTDVDTHVLLLPGQGLFCGNDCYFSNPEPDWGVQGDWQDDPFLDRDDVDGFGPENVNIERGINGQTYRVVLHYWADSHNQSFGGPSNSTVKLYIRGVLIQTWGPKRLGSTGDTWNVFEIDWPSQTIRTFTDPLYSVPSSTSCRATP
jgi:hypothetical protein